MTNQNTFDEITDNPDKKNTEESAQNSAASKSGKDSSLEALINQEQTLAREKLQKELEREPTQAEIDEWLQAHTESY